MERSLARLIPILAVAASCGGASRPSMAASRTMPVSDASRAPVAAGSAPTAAAGAPAPAPAAAGGANLPAAPPPVPQGPQPAPGKQPPPNHRPLKATGRHPLLIYTANLTLAVFEAAKAIDAVEELARRRGGYLVSRSDNAITIRIPAEIFHATLEEVAGLGDELHRNVSARDVTSQFRDLETRLHNLQAVRGRMEQLLKQAKSVQDALKVERELERITGQIEQIKGQLKLFSELIAFSTINVAFQARPVEKVDATVKLPFPWLDDLGLSRLLQL